MLGFSLSISRAQTPATANFRPERILVQPKKSVNLDTLAHFHAAHGFRILKTFDDLGHLQVVQVPKGQTVPGLIAQYQKSGLVEFAEPDYVVHACAAPNDPYYANGTLWGLNNTGQNGGVPGADIDAAKAWDVLNSASNIVVAVLDTGIRATHEDLAANMWTNTADGGDGFNAYTGKFDPADDNGHGTMVAGLIGAQGNNGKGVVGVAWKVQLMDCKCLDSNTVGSDFTVIGCLDFARTNGAQVINMSFDTTIPSLALSNALVAVRDAGIIVVASCGNDYPAGNDDVVPHYPACYPFDNIISVAYTTRTDGLGLLSNFGPTNVDLAAPGDQVTSTYYTSDSAYFVSAGIAGFSGTSFSAPLVSGACALMLAKFPAENYHQIIARIFKATDPLPALAGKCVTGGRLDLWKALSPPIDLSVIPATNGLPAQLQLSSDANRVCTIESSTDLVTWTPIFTNTTDTNGVFDFTDGAFPGAGQKFYRAASTP